MITRIDFPPPAVLMILLLCLLGPLSVPAAEIQDLYSAEVPVHSQDDSERLQAVATGLSTVLIKVSGRRETPTLPAMGALLDNPMQFMQQFRYHPLSELWQQTADDQGQFYSQVLHVSYDDKAINRALREAGQAVWGRARPALLVWLAVEDMNQRSILGAADSQQEVRMVLMRHAEQRGLPIILPLLDLQDQTSLGYADIWGDFQDDILRASGRYQAGGVLVGRLYRLSSDEWQARWTLYLQGDVQRWQTGGLQQSQALGDGLDAAADMIAGRFAQLPDGSGDNHVSVVVHDVTSLAAYARVMHYLESLDLNKDVAVEQVFGDRVMFSLTVRGELKGLEQAIEFGDTLTPMKDSDMSPGGGMIAGGAVTGEAVRGRAVTGPAPGAGHPVTGVNAATIPVLSYRLLP